MIICLSHNLTGVLQVTRPCIPCQHACHQLVCSDTCLAGDTQVVHVNVSGLTLEPLWAGLISNETRLQPYYLTVKAVTGSGRSVTATSRGIYLDVTPPVIQMMYHVDLAWSQSEPSAFQGDNSSMALYFEVVDPESKVVHRLLCFICLFIYLRFSPLAVKTGHRNTNKKWATS